MACFYCLQECYSAQHSLIFSMSWDLNAFLFLIFVWICFFWNHSKRLGSDSFMRFLASVFSLNPFISAILVLLIFYSVLRSFFSVWGLKLKGSPDESFLRVYKTQSATDSLNLTEDLLDLPSIGLGKTLYSFRYCVSLAHCSF